MGPRGRAAPPDARSRAGSALFRAGHCSHCSAPARRGSIPRMNSLRYVPAALAAAFLVAAPVVQGDETCNSPYMAKLIKGQEDYVYVWTLGVEGLGDGSDKLVTVDVDPKSKTYGKVIDQVSVGTRGEAHHMGFTDDRRRIWAGGLAGSDIYVFDIATDPARPEARQDDQGPRGQDRVHRPAHLLRAARPHARPGALQREGQGRCHRHGGLQQRGRASSRAIRCPSRAAGTATATTWP